MKPKYNLETTYVAIFLSTEGWICGPKDPIAVQGLLWFTGGSRTKQGTKAQIYGPNTKLFFSLSKDRNKRRFWKGARHSTGAPLGKNGGGGSITRDFERQVKKKKALEIECLFLQELCNGNLEGGPLYLGLWRQCRYIREGSGNGESLSIWRLCKGNLEGGHVKWGLQETCNTRLQKWIVCFYRTCTWYILLLCVAYRVCGLIFGLNTQQKLLHVMDLWFFNM
jgi:hypothetical protein